MHQDLARDLASRSLFFTSLIPRRIPAIKRIPVVYSSFTSRFASSAVMPTI